jgi:hypothetical protein
MAGGVALADIIDGTNNDETIRGTSGGDLIDAMGGDDAVYGLAGADNIQGGDGHDHLYGGQEAAISNDGGSDIRGGAGQDTILGSSGADILNGGPGPDRIDEGPADDAAGETIYGGDGDDDIDAASTPGVKDNVIDCGAGTDTVLADPVDAVAADCENVSRVPSIAPEMDPDAPAPEEAGLSSGSGEIQTQAFNCWGKTHYPHKSTHYAWRNHPRVATSVETWCLMDSNNLYTTANMYRLRAWGYSFLDDATKYKQGTAYQEVIPHWDCRNESDDFYYKTKSYHRMTNNGNAASAFTAAENPKKLWCV